MTSRSYSSMVAEREEVLRRERRWTNTRILGVCGLTAAVLGTLAGAVGSTWPRLGFVIAGTANAVMLGANLVLIFRKERS